MRLGLTNRIVDDSDSKPADFDCQFRSSISVQFKIQQRIRIGGCNFDLNSIIFDLNRSISIYFWLKDLKRPSKCRFFNQKQRLINQKWWIILKTANYIKNEFVFDHFRSNSTTFWYKSNHFWCKLNHFDVNGPDSNRIIATSKSESWNQIVIVD